MEHDDQGSLFDDGEGSSYHGPMKSRIEKLEEFAVETRDRLTAIETRLDALPDIFATKADLHQAISAQTWKLLTFVCSFNTALVTAVYYIAKHVH